jgi:hypothetical protein
MVTAMLANRNTSTPLRPSTVSMAKPARKVAHLMYCNAVQDDGAETDVKRNIVAARPAKKLMIIVQTEDRVVYCSVYAFRRLASWFQCDQSVVRWFASASNRCLPFEITRGTLPKLAFTRALWIMAGLWLKKLLALLAFVHCLFTTFVRCIVARRGSRATWQFQILQ